ncbi:hypothetical protein [Phenylobacterium sp. VNQ135]|uniref:hypothetical protein n=1 Tax=Phenylobacterium sp. VNQ135 TaxID=3400922 RepID=UPI003C2E56E7
MFKSSAELEAAKEEAIARVRQTYDATTRAIAGGLQYLAGPRDAPVDKLKVGVEAEMRKANAMAPSAVAKPATPKPVQPPRDPAQDLLDVIAQAEVKGHPVSYDVTFGFGKYDPAGYGKPVTAMTVDELARFQGELGRRSGRPTRQGSSAVGKYQITSALMPDLRRRLKLSGSELYDARMQERMGREARAARCAGRQAEGRRGGGDAEGERNGAKRRRQACDAKAHPAAARPGAGSAGRDRPGRGEGASGEL